MYKDINAFSWPVYRTQSYYTTDATYTIEYYCEAPAGTILTADAWRVKRVRYVTSSGKHFDTTRAINNIDSSRYDYNAGTADFIFKATNLAYVNALDYNDN